MCKGGFSIQAGSDIFGVTVSENGTQVTKSPALIPDVVMNTGTASKILLCGTENAEFNPDIIINNPQSDFFKMFPAKPSFFSDPF